MLDLKIKEIISLKKTVTAGRDRSSSLLRVNL
jgi:hypothetical protein